MVDVYLYIKWNRLRKKLQIYKQLAMISFDMTTIFYTVLTLGYILFAIITDGNVINGIQQRFSFIEGNETRIFSYLLLILPVIYAFQSFSYPGILFSNTEYILTLQPISRRGLWWLLSVEKWLVHGLVYVMMGAVYWLLLDISAYKVYTFVLILFILSMVMTPLQWKFFQLPFWKKITYLLILLMVEGLGLTLTQSIWQTFGILAVILVLLSVICCKYLMEKIDWDKVTAVADYRVWNIPLLSMMTKVKFQKPRKYTIWQRMAFYKKPFYYSKNTVYHRLWQLHFEKNKGNILKLLGALFLFLLVTVFLKQWIFILALFVSTQAYISLMAALFKDRFNEAIVRMLPWDLNSYKDTFIIWALTIGLIFIIPGIVYVIRYQTLISGVHLILFVLLLILQMWETLNKQIQAIDKTSTYSELILALCVAGMISIFFGLFEEQFLFLSVLATIALLLLKRKRTRT